MPNPMSLGILSKLYLNGGTYTTPIWVEADLISDLSVSSGWNEGESSVRRGRVQTFEQTNFRIELTGKIRKNLSDVAFNLMRNLVQDALVGDVLVLDGPLTINTSDGFRFPCRIFDWSEDQNLGDVVFKSFTMKPSGAAEDSGTPIVPMSATVVGGVLTYTAFGTGVVV